MNSEAIIECVPNFSEGTDAAKVRNIVMAMQVPGVSLLDWSLSTTAHNRSVVTVAGPADAVVESAVRGAGKAAELINLTKQSGVHPRIGSADVIPFIPVSGASLADCALLARQAVSRYGGDIAFPYISTALPQHARTGFSWRMSVAASLKDCAKPCARMPPAAPT